MHSWSPAGVWSDCCYTSDHRQAPCMWNKPREFTPYRGLGYEIAYETTGPATADGALASWAGSRMHDDVLLNRGSWGKQQWRSMGVALSLHYAVTWFGEEDDPDTARVP